jgi:hypothetical protein
MLCEQGATHVQIERKQKLKSLMHRIEQVQVGVHVPAVDL